MLKYYQNIVIPLRYIYVYKLGKGKKNKKGKKHKVVNKSM